MTRKNMGGPQIWAFSLKRVVFGEKLWVWYGRIRNAKEADILYLCHWGLKTGSLLWWNWTRTNSVIAADYENKVLISNLLMS